jgi:O-antigen/teichoic acid export membrane protein
MNLAIIPHYSLYAMGRDRAILAASAGGAALNVVLNALLVPAYGMLGAAAATAASLGTMGVAKLLLAARRPEGPA